MHRPAIWKIAILTAALGGLSIAGAGTALADTTHAGVPPLSVIAPVPADWPFDDLDDLITDPPPFHGHIVGFDDDWYGDDDWYDDDWDDDWATISAENGSPLSPDGGRPCLSRSCRADSPCRAA